MKSIYNKKYYGRGSEIGFINSFINILTWVDLNTFKKYFDKNFKILEVGCGDGKISRWMANRGYKIIAIDISEEAINKAKSIKSKAEFIKGEIIGLHLNKNYFEAVFCLHVMEHIKDIEATVREINRITKKGGILVVRIPNSDSFEATIAGKNWFHWDETYHVHHWTSEQFIKILESNGFKIKKINYRLLEFKQVLLYSVFNYFGVKIDTFKIKLLLVPLQLIFVPISIILGYVFKNSGTVEIVAIND